MVEVKPYRVMCGEVNRLFVPFDIKPPGLNNLDIFEFIEWINIFVILTNIKQAGFRSFDW